ncbi:MAG: sugar ABC transporter permease [Lachnospiraceae bacterium]|nr:sugar ABC transporter permease [Lachnospiraceae bacterium]
MSEAVQRADRYLRKNAAKSEERRKSHAQRGRRGKAASWLFLLPSLFGVGLFFVAPFCVVIRYSLVNNPVQGRFVGIGNYIRVLGNGAFLLAAKNTLLFSAIAVPLAVALSLWLAVIMESRIPFRSQFRSFFLTPMMVPVASVILIWQVLFDYNGLVNVWLTKIGIDKIDWLKSPYAPLVVVLLFLWKNLGYNMILFMAGLSAVPRDQIEVARLESASERQIFWLIKIRYLSSTIAFVTIMSLINSFKVFREVYLLTGDYPFDSLYLLQHFMNNTFQSLDYQKLSAAAVIMAVVMVVIIGLLLKAESKLSRDL